MPHHVKRIARTTGAKSTTYAGPAGELVMDITNNDLVLQNGQAGGVRLAKASTVIDATNGVNITTGGTLGATTVVSGVDASTSAKGVVQLSNATDGTSQAMAATPKAVSDALQAAKDYADTAAGSPYTGTAPINVNSNTRVISAADATTSAKGVMQVGDNVTVNNGVVSVKPWAVHSATAAAVNVSDVQEGALIQTDEPIGGNLAAVIAQVEQTLSGSPSLVPSSFAVKSAMESLLAPVYVNGTTGDDANDGMTAATAVKTINRALVLANNRGKSNPEKNLVRVIIASGTYVEDVVVRCAALFEAQGLVTVNGYFYASWGGFAQMSGPGSYVINGYILSGEQSALIIDANVTLNYVASSATTQVLVAGVCSLIVILKPVTITSNSLSNAVLATTNSMVSINAQMTINSTAVGALAADVGGIVLLDKGSNVNIAGTYSDAVVVASLGSCVYIRPDAVLSGTPTGKRFLVNSGSVITTFGGGASHIPGSQPGFADPNTYGVYY